MDIQTTKSSFDIVSASEDEGSRITPQHVQANIRVGDYVDIPFNISEPEKYPIELYYLMDVSYSMREDMKTMKSIGEMMADKLKSLTGADADSLVRIGFGTFVDKVTSPQTEMLPYRLQIPYDDADGIRQPFVYRNVNPLTENIQQYNENIRDEHVSGNLDGPEGALEAIHHALNCREQIGWQENTLKLLVVATESWFHFGGDGMGKLAGLLEPAPAGGECQLQDNEVSASDHYDYPTVAQIVTELHENSVIPIFAVRKEQLARYDEATTQLFRGGTAQALEANSSNILDIIEDSYKRITQKQHLLLKQSEEIDSSVVCLGTEARYVDGDGQISVYQHGEDVTDLNSKSTVEYTLREAVHTDAICERDDQVVVDGKITVRTQRYEDALTITTSVKCNFDCMRNVERNASKCNGNGDLACGVCQCDDAHFGDLCQFDKPECPPGQEQCDGMTECVNPVTGQICTLQGQCPVDVCDCNHNPGGVFSGKWCQCNTQDCFNDGSLGGDRGVCSGNGKCVCDGNDGHGISACECDEGYTGDKCHCSTSVDECIEPGSNEECSGHGTCQCGACVCDFPDEWTGAFCNIKNCSDNKCVDCPAFQGCVECSVHADNGEECECPEKSSITAVETGALTDGDHDRDIQLCAGFRDVDGKRCKFYYAYREMDDSIEVWAEKGEHCQLEYSLLIILWAVLIALLIGLLFLCCWRICVFCVDRERTYATVAYLVEFIKAKYHFRRSQGVAVIPVRRSVFDDACKCKWRTFPGSVSDDVVKIMREGEMEMEEMNQEGPNWGSGEVEWEPGKEMADIYIDIKSTDFEGNETAFWIELMNEDTMSAIHYGRRRTKVLLIRDDDPGSIGFLKPTYVFKESDMFAVVPVHRTNGSDGQVTVKYTARDVTAKSGQHYRQCQGELTFADGELSKDIAIELIQDDSSFDCIERTFNLELSEVSSKAQLDNDKCLVRILSDETASVVQFLRPAYPFLENCTNAAVPVVRTRSTKGVSMVHYRTRDITAKAGIDYVHVEGVIKFGNEETEKIIEIQIIENQELLEEGRTFNVELYEPSEGTKVGRNACAIKIIEDDDPGRFELIRSSYMFKGGPTLTEIPVIRSMGADGRVEVPWEIVAADDHPFPPEAKMDGSVTFDNMDINGTIELSMDADWAEDVTVTLRLLQPTNNARLGAIKEATLTILGKGRYDEVKMELPFPDVIRGANMSPVTVNFQRIIRCPGQTTVVMFETEDGTAEEEKHDYYGVKKAIVFEPDQTMQQVQIHVNDEYDEDNNDPLYFTLKMTAISEHVILANQKEEMGITSPIMANEQSNLRGRYGAKVSFTHKKYLTRMSEREVQIEIKRQGKENKDVDCFIVSRLIEGEYVEKERSEERHKVTFPANTASYTYNWTLPQVESKQLLTAFDLVDFSSHAQGGSITTTEVTVINDIHAGIVGFAVPEMTQRVTDMMHQITLLRAGGTDGTLNVVVLPVDKSAVNGIHFQLESPVEVTFEDGQHEATFDVTFCPGNHGKMIARKFDLAIDTVSGLGRIGQDKCTIQLVTDQTPCAVSFAKAKFSFLAASGDQGVPLLRTGANENAAHIAWRMESLPAACGDMDIKQSGIVSFAPGSNRSMLKLPSELIDAAVNDSFDIIIEPDDPQSAVSLGEFAQATVSVISGAEYGKFEFLKTRVVCKQNERSYDLPVIRQGGSDGISTVNWITKSKLDCYNGLSGDLVFEEGIFEQNISLEINNIMQSDMDAFTVTLTGVTLGSVGTRREANISIVRETKELEFEFETDYLSTRVGDITADVDIIVKGEGPLEDSVSLRFTTQPETAIPGQHYLTKSEQVLFKPGDTCKQVQIGLLEAPLEEPVTLTLALLVAQGPGRIGTKNECLVNIPPAGHPGQISFTRDSMEVSQSERIIRVPLVRAKGTRGALLCPWFTTGDNWYNDAAGQIMFEDGQNETFIDFPLMAQPTDDPFHEFQIELRKPNGHAELGAMPVMTIRVRNDIPGGTMKFKADSSEIMAIDGMRTHCIPVASDGRNRVPIELCYQLKSNAFEQEDDNAPINKVLVEAGEYDVLLEIPVVYLPSGETQEFFCTLLSANHGARIGSRSNHKISIVSAKRKVGFTRKAVDAKQSNRDLNLTVERTVSTQGRIIVPWIAYTSPEPVKGVCMFDDGQSSDIVKIPFKHVYVSGAPLSESFEVEINPGAEYDLTDINKCFVTVANDLGPGIVEFESKSIKQIQSKGNLALRMVRHERHLEEATVKWRCIAREGSHFKGLVGTVQFQCNDHSIDLVIPVPEFPCDEAEDQFIVELDQPINATLGDCTKCNVTMLNDKTAGEISFSDKVSRRVLQSEESVTIKVRRVDIVEGDIIVPWRIQSHNLESNYHDLSGQLEFPTGIMEQTIELTFPVCPQEEEQENLEIVLDRPVGGARLADGYQKLDLTIENDIQWPIIGLAEESYTFDQSKSPHEIHVERSGDVNSEVKVDWHFVDVENGVDYVEFNGTLAFAPGVCEMPILFPSPLMTKAEGNVKLDLKLTMKSEPIITRVVEAPITINNDIEPCRIGFKLKSATEIKQSDKEISLLLTRTGFAFGEVDVTWAINTRLNDKDFIEKQHAHFGPGELEKEISFALSDKPMKDKNGKYGLTAGIVSGDAILDMDAFKLDIAVNNDIEWPLVEFAEATMSMKQSEGTLSIPVVRNLTANFIRVNWREVGEREFGTDWRKDAGVLEFQPLCGIMHISLACCPKPTMAKTAEIELELAGAAEDQDFLLGINRKCLITLIQDVPFPAVSFGLDNVKVNQSQREVELPVKRELNMESETKVEWSIKSNDGYYTEHGGGLVIWGEGEHEQIVKLNLCPKLAELPESQLTMMLVPDMEVATVGEIGECAVTIKNDLEPVSIEMALFECPVERTAGSIPIRLNRKGTADCAVTCSCEVSIEGQVIQLAQVTFSEGQTEASFDLLLDQMPRYTDIDDYVIKITKTESAFTPKNETPKEFVVPVQNDVERSEIRVTALNDEVAQSTGQVELKVERTGNLKGSIMADYELTGGKLDGFKGTVSLGDGEREKLFTVNLAGDPLDGDSSKMKVKITNADGVSCPKIDSADFEFSMVHDVKPVMIGIVQPDIEIAQSQGVFTMKMTRSLNLEGSVTVPYHIESDLPDFEVVKGVVLLDEGETETDIQVKIDMAPNNYPDVQYRLVLGDARGVKDAVIEQKVFAVDVKQDLHVPTVDFSIDSASVDQSAGSIPLTVTRRDNAHGSIMIKYAVTSSSLGRVEKWEKIEPGVTEHSVDIPLYPDPADQEEEEYTIELLEAEGETMPQIGECDSCTILVLNDIKPTKITMPMTSYQVKQTDLCTEIPVVRLEPNLDDLVEIGWHVEPVDYYEPIDYFYERQRGTVRLADGSQESRIKFSLIQVPQKQATCQLKIVLEQPCGGLKPEILNGTAQINIENNIPRPLIQLDIQEDKIKQTAGGVSLPVSRSRFLGGKILVPWYLDVSNENSPYYGVGGREMIDDGEESTEIKFKLPNFPLWAESNKLILRLGGLGGDHFPEQAPDKGTTKVYVDNDIQSETVSFLGSEKVIKQTDCEKLLLHVNRSGFLNTELLSKWFIKSIDPIYSAFKGEINFGKGDVDKTIEIVISQDPSELETSVFTVALSIPTLINVKEQDSPVRRKPKLGKFPVCAVTVVNDVERPTASLPVEKITIRQSERVFSIGVVRGGLGECIVAWRIVDARLNSPYQNLSGSAKFTGEDQLFTVQFDLPQTPQDIPEDKFMIQLLDPKGQNNPMLGAIHAAEVTVINDIKAAIVSFTTETLALKQSDKQLTIPICRLYNSIGQLTLKFKVESTEPSSLLGSFAVEPLIINDGEELSNMIIQIPQRVSAISAEKIKISIMETASEGESFWKLGKSSCLVSIDYDIKDAKFSFELTQVSLRQKDKKCDVVIKRTGNTSGSASLKLQQRCASNPFYDKPYAVLFFDGESEKKIEVELDANPSQIDEDDVELLLEAINDEEVVIPMICNIKVVNDLKPTVLDFAQAEFVLYQSESYGLVTVRRSTNLQNLASVRWQVTTAESPFTQNEGRVSFDENQNKIELKLPIRQDLMVNETCTADIELFEAKGDRATLGINNQASLVVHADLVFFEFEQTEIDFAQSNGLACVPIRRLNNLRKKVDLEYHTSSPLVISEWKDVTDFVTFTQNQELAKVEMEFDPTPMSVDKERILLSLKVDQTAKQRLGANQQCVLNVAYDVEPTKIDFSEPIIVASKSVGRVELPVVCVAKSRTSKSSITVSWHSDGLRKEQKGQVYFKGEQGDATIVVNLERIKATEFEVYIQEVKGAQYVSITQPKCKVKVVDDCPTYGFQQPRIEVKQSVGDIQVPLSSQICASGRSIAWRTETVLPKSPFQLSGETLIEPDRNCSIRIPMPTRVMPITVEEFKVKIDLEQNRGLITDVQQALTCTCIVHYDVRPGVVAFKQQALTVQRRESDTISVVVTRTNSTKGDVTLVYQMGDDQFNLFIAEGQSEGTIDVPIEQVPMKDATTVIKMQLVSIKADDAPVELGKVKTLEITVNNDVPLPVFEFKADASKIVQSLEKIEIPVIRTAGARSHALINWRVSSAPTESKLLNTSGKLTFADGQLEQPIEIKLPQLPNLLREEDVEIELFNSIDGDIASSALVGAACLHQLAVTYDRPFAPVNISLSEAIINARQSDNYARIMINRSESPIPTAIAVSWIAKPDTPAYPVQTGVAELYEPGKKMIEFPLPEKPTVDQSLNIEFELVKADMHTNDSRQTCAIVKSKTNLCVEMDKSINSVYASARQFAFKQSEGSALIQLNRSMATGLVSVPWKTVSQKASKYSKLSGLVEFEPGVVCKSIEIPLNDNETSDDEDDFTLVVMNPISNEEIVVTGPTEINVSIKNDLISNQVGFRESCIEAKQSEEVLAVNIQRTGTVETVSWCKWKVEGATEMSGMATFQPNQSESVIMINLSQKPQEEPITVMKIELCEPGAASIECKPVVSANSVSVIKIFNDIAKPKIEFPLSQIDFVQSQKELNIPIVRLGYKSCMVACDWTSSRGESGRVEIPEYEDQAKITIVYDQEPQQSPLEVVEITLENPQSSLIMPDLGAHKCFVKVNNDISPVVVEVAETEIYAKQSDGVLLIPVKRSIAKSNILVAWNTVSNDALSPYANLTGDVGFTDTDNISYIKIDLTNEAQKMKRSEFDLDIHVKAGAIVGKKRCRVIITNDLKQSVVAVKSPTDGKTIEFKQTDKKCYLHVTRRECVSERIQVPWHVTSKDHNSIWNSVQGTVVFEEGQYESVIEMDMPGEPNSSSPAEQLDLILDQPEGRAELDSHLRACSFKVINDIGSGLVEFGSPTYLINSNQGNVTLIRTRGVAFVSVVEWEAQDGTAKASEHFSPPSGSVLFAVGQSEAEIPITVHNDPTGTPTTFRILLKSVSCRDQLGPCINAEVHIGNQLEAPGQVNNLSATLTADQQVEIKWSKPTSGGPPAEYVVLIWRQDEPNKKIENVYESNVFTCTVELEPNTAYFVTVVPRNSAGNEPPCIPVKVKTLPSIVLSYKNNYQFNSSEGKAEITITRNTTEFQTTLVWRMMRKTIHLPNEQSSNYSDSNEVEPLCEGRINFQKGLNKLTLPITLREDMKTMRENNSLYLYQPGGDELAVIRITVLNDSGIPGRVGQLRCTNIGSRELDVAWEPPKIGGPVEKYKLSIRDLRTGKERQSMIAKDKTETTLEGLTPDNDYKIKVVAINTHGKSRYSKFVKVRTLNELEFVDLVDVRMSERLTKIKVKRKSTKIPMKFNWTATGLAEVPQNWGTGEIAFTENQEIGFVQLSLENQLIKHESVMVSIVIYDGERELCQCKVRVIDDIYPGCLTFAQPRIEANVDIGTAKIEVKRINGKDGKVGCFWNTMEISAKSEEHFVDTKGMVVFDDGEDEQIIEVPLISTSKFNDFVEFKVVLIEPQGKCSLGNNQKCYVRLLPPEAKFMFSEKFLTYRLSEKMAIIPVERRFTSGISTLKWHTRWSKDEKDAENEEEIETDGDEPRNWASGFIVFKDGQQKAHIEVPLIDKIPKKRSLCWVYISDGKTSKKIAKTQMQLIEDRLDPPTNIRAEAHATSCLIQWDAQKYVREYQITYSETSRNSIKLVKVDGSEDNVVLLELIPCTEYEIMIAAINQFGNSATSETITIVTPGLPPGKPSRLAFQLLSPTSLQVNWGEPSQCNGEILAYCVEYHTIDETSGIEPVVVPLPGPDHRSLLVENLIENMEYRYTVRAENKWGLGDMRTARMWIKPMHGKGSRPPSTVVLGSESSINAHSTYQDEHGRQSHYVEMDDEGTTTDCYRSEKHKTWTTRSRGGFTTDTANSDIDIDLQTPRTEDMLSPDLFTSQDNRGMKVTRTEFTSPTQSEKKTILEEETHLDRNKLLRTTVDVDSKPEVKMIKIQEQRKFREGTKTEQQQTKIGYEESTHDLRHRIHRDEHVDTSVNKYDDGDTEVTEIRKKFTQRVVQETTETHGTKSMSAQHTETTPKAERRYRSREELDRAAQRRRSGRLDSTTSDSE